VEAQKAGEEKFNWESKPTKRGFVCQAERRKGGLKRLPGAAYTVTVACVETVKRKNGSFTKETGQWN